MTQKSALYTVLLITCMLALTNALHYEYERMYKASPITYGSALRLESINSGYYLFSNDITYGYGSRQHIMTAHPDEESEASLWYVKEQHGQMPKEVSKLE